MKNTWKGYSLVLTAERACGIPIPLSPCKTFLLSPWKILFFPPCSVCGSEYYVHLWTLQIHISITGRCNISCVIVAPMSAMLCARTHSARPPWGRWGSTPAIYSTAVRENDSLNACGNNYDYTAETARKHRVWRVCLCVCVWACPHVRIVFEGVMLQDHTWEWALIGETRWGAFIEVRLDGDKP